MTVWFVSRHPGALDWAKRRGIRTGHQVKHLNIDDVQSGDIVIGSLPVNLAAQVCERNAAYWHLSLELPAAWRGRELSADDLEAIGARVEAYHVRRRPMEAT